MNLPGYFRICAAGAGFIVVTAASLVAAGVPATTTISQLDGRWTGPGVVVPSNGPKENFRCVVTYKATQNGARVSQRLNCTGSNYRLDAATHLAVKGKRVTGSWRENTHAIDGSVTGTVTDNGFDILLSGTFFRARMKVAGTGCIQSVKVSPSSKDRFRRISAALKRC